MNNLEKTQLSQFDLDGKDDQINAVFSDWDCGRDQNGHYFSDAEARAKKEAFLPSLLAFTPAASIIVETRNGFHAYWLMNPGVTSDQFRDCQSKLAAYFHGDGVITNPARVMRLPGF